MRNSFKMTFEPLMDFFQRKLLWKLELLRKLLFLKVFLHPSYKNTQSLFFVTVDFNIFMRQTLTNDFLGVTRKCELRVFFKPSKVL